MGARSRKSHEAPEFPWKRRVGTEPTGQGCAAGDPKGGGWGPRHPPARSVPATRPRVFVAAQSRAAAGTALPAPCLQLERPHHTSAIPADICPGGVFAAVPAGAPGTHAALSVRSRGSRFCLRCARCFRRGRKCTPSAHPVHTQCAAACTSRSFALGNRTVPGLAPCGLTQRRRPRAERESRRRGRGRWLMGRPAAWRRVRAPGGLCPRGHRPACQRACGAKRGRGDAESRETASSGLRETADRQTDRRQSWGAGRGGGRQTPRRRRRLRSEVAAVPAAHGRGGKGPAAGGRRSHQGCGRAAPGRVSPRCGHAAAPHGCPRAHGPAGGGGPPDRAAGAALPQAARDGPATSGEPERGPREPRAAGRTGPAAPERALLSPLHGLLRGTPPDSPATTGRRRLPLSRGPAEATTAATARSPQQARSSCRSRERPRAGDGRVSGAAASR